MLWEIFVFTTLMPAERVLNACVRLVNNLQFFEMSTIAIRLRLMLSYSSMQFSPVHLYYTFNILQNLALNGIFWSGSKHFCCKNAKHVPRIFSKFCYLIDLLLLLKCSEFYWTFVWSEYLSGAKVHHIQFSLFTWMLVKPCSHMLFSRVRDVW